jgi:hypothetical protein
MAEFMSEDRQEHTRRHQQDDDAAVRNARELAVHHAEKDGDDSE